MMTTLLELQSVSRKTPLDGRLEITEATAARLARLGLDFPLLVGDTEARATLDSLTCACGKRAGGSHVHHFLSSAALKELTPGTEVRIELGDGLQLVRVKPT